MNNKFLFQKENADNFIRKINDCLDYEEEIEKEIIYRNLSKLLIYP